MASNSDKQEPTYLKRFQRLALRVPVALRTLIRLPARSKSEDASSEVVIDPTAPGTFQVGKGERLRVGVEPSPDGDMLQIARRPYHDDNAAVKIQAAFRRYKARALFESLQTLRKMNLDIRWPEAIPFIGMLIVRANSIKNLAGVRTAIVRTKFDGDISSNIPGQKQQDHVIYYNERATFVNVAVRSNSVLTIEVMQSFELGVRMLGKIHMPISMISQGVEERNEDIRSNTGEVLGTMNMTVGYQWLRETTDFGGYNGPEILILQSRKIRGTMPQEALERLWKVNHWVCSHDNVWCAAPGFADVVKEAVRRERNRSTMAIAYDEDGKTRDLDNFTMTTHIKNAIGEREGPVYNSAELLQRVAGTTDFNEIKPFDSISSSSTVQITSTLGEEDWKSALADYMSSQRSDQSSSGTVEEEVDFDYDKPPEELLIYESDETSESSEETIVESSTTAQKSDEKGSCPIQKITKKLIRVKSKREPPTEPSVTGKFEYGAYRPASKRGVHIFARRVDNSTEEIESGMDGFYMGCHKTSKRGRLEHPLPKSVSRLPGLYNILCMLPDDNTFGHGSMYLLEKGTKCVVFDLDGTITTSDVHVVAQTLLDSVSASTVIGSSIGRSYDIRARTNALACVRAWAAKGYQVIYLSGRQGSAYNMTLEWLNKHGYPPGPIHLTRTHLPTLPVYVSVGHFKIKYMEELKLKGLELYAAYGNTGTDIKAYDKVGIPKERTFIVGAHGGKKNTQAVKDFTTHLPQILLFPDSDKPLPYTELLRTSPLQPGDGRTT